MSRTQEIRVPDIGDFEQVPVIDVLVSNGDRVEAEQSLVTLESDKATMDIPSPAAGRIVEISVSEGAKVSEGDVIGSIALDEENDAPEPADVPLTGNASEKTESAEGKEQARTEEAPKPRPPIADAASDESLNPPPVPFEGLGHDPSTLPHASPSVRKLARELGVDLVEVQGSGRKGRIQPDDLKAHVKSRLSNTASGREVGTGFGFPPLPEVDFAKYGPVEEQALSRIQKLSGPNLHRNWVSIPHVTQFDEADITETEAFRKASQKQAEHAGTRMTPLVFLIKAAVAALKEFPQFNASLSQDGQSLVCKRYFHVGVAVDTPGGLVVPVLRDCDTKGLIELALELTELSGKAREGRLKAEEMKGGCFTISSLGGIGGTAFTPIINAPELAILGVSRAETKPVWTGEGFEPRLKLPLSLSYDHRVIDGAAAARFTRYLAEQLEDLRRLLL
ncbi:MAG: dihydrolipoyllysine-residue acetyltransferase [Wenzhouxiangella sp.]|jgi:pyruvate dehydrogenase E2 component (dihydrolipoamide acetyltransferase)|nr:dihydrolipoyllysine-residue acetyltransferase [Wenzhouxiangella sp.]